MRNASSVGMGSLVALSVAAATACIAPDAVVCDDGRYCPSGTVCVASGCARTEQIAACEGRDEGAGCTLLSLGEGLCRDGVCVIAACGDGFVDEGEICDDGDNDDGDGCSRDCRSDESCGNNVRDPAEVCDDGNRVDDDGCSNLCAAATCGDGIVQTTLAEVCDDGGDNSDAADAACRTNCLPRRCGDGIADNGEACDNGNTLSGDGCSADCSSDETCPNGIVDLGEPCDDGNAIDDDLCSDQCVVASCGDGVAQPVLSEICDLGAANSEAPDAACRTNCLPRRCGDDVDDTGEICDDANNVGGDGCSADCTSDESCPNGIVDVGEQCDDGNAADDDQCHHDCTVPFCGDGILNPQFGEGCDDGADNSPLPDAECRLTCQPRRCGDTTTDPGAGEVCDDGNNLPGDSCGFDCRSDETCGNGEIDFFIGERCDDGNRWSHDGCTQACLEPDCTRSCQAEELDWSPRASAAPSARVGQAMAYDVWRGRIVLFGGVAVSGGASLADTWEWDGSGWRQILTSSAPSGRGGHAMAYDAARRQVVLFGGAGSSGLEFADTWTWDGVTWLSYDPPWPDFEAPAPGPTTLAPRTLAAIAYDPIRERVVLFGGHHSQDAQCTESLDPYYCALDDTWEWDSVRWIFRGYGGPRRQSHAMAFNPRSGLVHLAAGEIPVLFGGNDLQNDHWSWDGATGIWSPRALPPAGLTPRYRPTMAFDPVADRMVLFGGDTTAGTPTLGLSSQIWHWEATLDTWALAPIGGRPTAASQVMVGDAAHGRMIALDGYLARTFALDANGWSLVAFPTMASPVPRRDHAVAYDPLRARLVMFGGSDGVGTALADTWEWDGAAWRAQAPATSPPARERHAMAFDPTDGAVVLFGGIAAGIGIVADTWRWDATAMPPTWSDVSARSALRPSVRYGAALAPLSSRGQLVLFGGIGSITYAETWIWNAMGWSQPPLTSPIPPARFAAGMAEDAVRGELVLFGGTGNANELGDTWIWNGDGWQQPSPDAAHPPPPASHLALAFDATRGRVVQSDGAWSWAGMFWERASLASTQRGRYGAVAFDPTHASLILVGNIGEALAGTWALRYQSAGASATVDEGCATGLDGDGDLFAGCDDLDCWGSCTPLCPPTLAAVGGCEVTDAPRCGDSTCSAMESPGSCPADCLARPLCGDAICDPGELGCPGDCPA